jgi:predicted RNase H-like HicB family nuclease
MAKVTFNVVVTEESDGSYWAEVDELPGCFASGFSVEELQAALFEAMQLWLPDGIKLGTPKWEIVDEDPPSMRGSRKSPPRKTPPRPRSKRQKMLVCA